MLPRRSSRSTALSKRETASPGALALVAELALEAYDTKRAEQLLALALKQEPSSYEARHILTRAYVMKGDGAAAVNMAARSRSSIPSADSSKWRRRSFRSTGWKKRGSSSSACAAPTRRRATSIGASRCCAYQGGDYDEAQRRFAELATSDEATDAALLYLADIAELDGDTDTALAGYKRLINSSLADRGPHARGVDPAGKEAAGRRTGDDR